MIAFAVFGLGVWLILSGLRDRRLRRKARQWMKENPR